MNDFSRHEFEDFFDRGTRQALKILRDRQLSEDVATEALGRLVMDGAERRHFALIVKRIALDKYRQREARHESPVGELETFEGLEEQGRDVLWQGAPLTVEQVEFRTDFDQAVRDLPIELDRQAFLLTTVRGLTYREAAEVLDIDHTSVHRHAERARTQIKEALT